MKLTLQEITENPCLFTEKGIKLPEYDVVAAREKAVAAPRWVHFGIGNIFRVFIGGIAEDLMNRGLLDRGITCAETFDEEVVDKIYRPFDNLALSVILNPDGTREMRVLASMAEAVKAIPEEGAQWQRMQEIFRSESLEMVSYTITEKGYVPGADFGTPDKPRGAMGVTAALLRERFLAGGRSVALVSMDNCARNGKLLKASVTGIVREWIGQGVAEEGFLAWLEGEDNVAFLSTMIDKITPRPGDELARDLADLGLEDLSPVITSRRTYIAPFVNGERPQYLVIEDRFPNGRPALEEGFGVYMGDFDTVCRSERMKVTACLNPAHTAVGPLGVVLGQEKFADMLRDIPATLRMAQQVIYGEGLPVAPSPGILSPKAFADEVFQRFTNLYLGDTNLRLATDASQGLAVRFGETIKSYCARFGSAESLLGIPFGIAGFFRYLLEVDDQGEPYELAPDPLAGEIHAALAGVWLGQPETLQDQLRPYLSDETLFGIDLYAAGLGSKVEGFLREMLAGPGSTRATLERLFPET